MSYNETTSHAFVYALALAQCQSFRIAEATTPAHAIEASTFYLHEDSRSGFALTSDGELCGVFSLERGRGTELLRHAIYRGAERLDCFDGYLPSLYARHGFVEVSRQRNWTPGKPDVVFMALAQEVAL